MSLWRGWGGGRDGAWWGKARRGGLGIGLGGWGARVAVEEGFIWEVGLEEVRKEGEEGGVELGDSGER